MRYDVRKSLQRQVQQDSASDVYFWDGEVCVRSTAITVGNPPSTTISVPNLHGVAVARDTIGTLPALAYAFFFAFLFLFGGLAFVNYKIVGTSILLAAGVWFYLVFRPRPWEVRLKMGGILADEIFSSRSQQWAHQFGQAVSDAILAARTRGGSGGQEIAAQAIFPDPVLTRN